MLKDIISSIKPLDEEAMNQCQLRLDNLTKPLGSLYSFEHLARQIAGITANPRPRSLKKSIILMAADHGVAKEEVNTFPQEGTTQKIINICNGDAAINVFAEHVSAELVLVDIGVTSKLPSYLPIYHEKIARGTKNITKGSAMTRKEAMQAIEVGIKIARQEIEKGVQIFGLGNVGSGYLIPSTAIIACYSPKSLTELIVNNGIPDTALSKTLEILDKDNPLDVLSEVGGLEIAGLVGVILGAVSGGAAVILDGLITSAAALIAVKIAPRVKDYLIGSHFSKEPAHKEALDIIGIPGYLHLDMFLGEGTGAALGMSLVNASLHVLNDMKTFGEAEVAVAEDGPGALKQNKDIRE